MKKEKIHKDINCFADAIKENIGRSGNKNVKSRPPLSEVCYVKEYVYFDYPFKKLLGKFSKWLPKISYLKLNARLEVENSVPWIFETTCILTKNNKNKLYDKIYKECSEKYESYCQLHKEVWE